MRNLFKSFVFFPKRLYSESLLALVMNSLARVETSFSFLLFFSFAGRIPEVGEYPGDAIMMEATFIYVRQNGGPFLSLFALFSRRRVPLLFARFLLSFRQVTD